MSKTVRAAHIDRTLTRLTVEAIFGRFGKITRITLPRRRSESDALIEFSTRAQAKKAISELDSTTLNDIHGKNKRNKRGSPEFIWQLSLLSETAHLWEEDKEDKTLVEKAIVKEKRKNLAYVESVGAEITLNEHSHQRPAITHTAPNISSKKTPSQ
ncbi:hypothetical protein NEDG_01902 [Nematocida displodere]|uniref:RRM domain-containing protein n=1 Tax=Nematocida displodere TaxID=1805483 RepID=A0A177EGY1_9MICR|nr:hypothetical protein NEDG_01902 [Nematocida displodere]